MCLWPPHRAKAGPILHKPPMRKSQRHSYAHSIRLPVGMLGHVLAKHKFPYHTQAGNSTAHKGHQHAVHAREHRKLCLWLGARAGPSNPAHEGQARGQRARGPGPAAMRGLTLSVSAMKNMLSSVVDISNACGLFSRSSAPLIDRHRRTCAHALSAPAHTTHVWPCSGGLHNARADSSGAKHARGERGGLSLTAGFRRLANYAVPLVPMQSREASTVRPGSGEAGA